MTDWLVENKDGIERSLQVMAKGAALLASTVGELHPLLETVFNAAAKLLTDPEGGEARYLTEKFTEVNQHLGRIENEMKEIRDRVKRMNINVMNFDYEANILTQNSKFQDFVNAKPSSRETKKRIFITQFENTGGDRSLAGLYDNFLNGMLATIMETEKRDRRAVENFCAGLKRLFVVGIISVMGHAALKDGNVGQDVVTKWLGNMKEVEIRMKAAVDECVEKFPEQAEEDMKSLIVNNSSANESITGTLLDELIKKYDWVSWSVRAFRDQEFFLFRLFLEKQQHGVGGKNSFHVPQNNIIFVFSYCVDPKPINKSQILEQVELKKLKGNKDAVASDVQGSFPSHLVHAISTFKAVAEKNNFPEDCYYFGKHKKAYLCIHPE